MGEKREILGLKWGFWGGFGVLGGLGPILRHFCPIFYGFSSLFLSRRLWLLIREEFSGKTGRFWVKNGGFGVGLGF